MQILDRLIGQRIFWILSGVLPLALFAVWMFVIFTDQQESAINQLINESAASAAHSLDRTLQQQIGLLEGLAIARSLDAGDFDLFRISAQRLKDKHSEWRTVILTDAHRQLFNLRIPPGQPLDPVRDRRSLARVWETGRAVVGDLSHGFVPVRTPVLRAERMQYTLVVPIDPRFFLSALEGTGEARGRRYVIAGSDGIVIAASPGVAVTTGQPLPPGLTTASDISHTAVGGMLHARPLEIPTSGWRVHLMVPAASVKTPFIRARLVVFVGGVIASALTVGLILALSAIWAGRQEKRRLQAQIDERIKVQEVLHRSEMALKEAQRLAEVGNWSWDLQTGDHSWSEEVYHIYGRDPALPPAAYPEVRRYFTPESWARLSAAVEAGLAEGKDYACDAEVIRQDGTRRWITARGVAERAADGRVLCLKGTVQDITGRKKADDEQHRLQQQLVQAQKMESIGRLAGGVAHDFNNILSVIIGHAEIAMSDLEPEHRLQADLKVIYDAALRSTGIIRQLLTFSRKQIVLPVVLELNEVIEGMLKMLGRLIGEDIELVWVPAGERLLIRIDPAQIDQILANLCVNARDAIVDTGRIDIATHKVSLDAADCAARVGIAPGEYAVLTVRDNGCGMAGDVVDKIFEPFFSTKGERGTGLGLATVYGIVQQNHGCIDVDSAPGAGTTFSIFLPLVGVEALQETEAGPATIGTGGGETALLVEDDPATLKICTAMLQRLGFTVLMAATPREGIEIVRRHDGRIALLITDVILPQMNGRQLTQEILAIHPDLRVIYMSGYTADVIAHHGVLDEGIHFLQKPFTRKDLAAMISEVLA
ncbi:MAG: ATP-binding protein [Desulfoprunum sp.]|uniref:ATP-binding protein n=1 Tax=Desulfoprunum sp. TaxID=2020866 RepID=UPI003C742DFD